MPTTPRVLDLALSLPWAIYQPALTTLLDIAARQDVDPTALAAWKNHAADGSFETLSTRQGERLAGTSGVVIRDNVAVVSAIGPIFRYASLFTDFSGGAALSRLAQDFQAAIDAGGLRAILLNLDTPGGEANGIAEFAAQIRSAAGKLPVVAYVGGMGASAGYWLASAASEIVVAPTAMVGSIGVVMASQDTRARDAKAGITTWEFVSSQSPMKRPDPATEAGSAHIQAMVDRLAEEFVSNVAAYRGVSVAKVLADFGQGGVLMGADAVAAGMADRVGSFEQTLARLAGRSTAGPSGITVRLSPGQTSPQARENVMDEQTNPDGQPAITAQFIATHHPAIAAQFQTEGAAAERARILAIQTQAALPGHDALVAQCIHDGSSAGDAALKITAAEKAKLSTHLSALAAGAEAQPKLTPSASLDPVPVDDGQPAADAPPDVRARAAWDNDQSLRAEFGTFETFLALAKAEGLDRVVKSK